MTGAGVVLAPVVGAVVGADGAMMEDEQSITLFVLLTAGAAVAAVVGLPAVLQRMPLRRSVPALAVIGPALAAVGSLVGSAVMSLSGADVRPLLIVGALTGVVAIVVGLRLARPLTDDLTVVSDTVGAIAGGDRSARTGIDRGDELGELAATVDELAATLQRTEAEREAADSERRGVVSALSHDLRTPLASLLVSVDALEDGVADPATHLGSMRRNVDTLRRLVDDLFLLARADSGAMALQVEAVDLGELVDEALEAVGPSAHDAGVALAASIDAPVRLDADPGAIGRVLRNVLDNAIRFGANVEVQVGTRAGAAVVDVVDDGPGFAPEFVDRAFERFSQADAARSGHGGAGLGLATAQTLVAAHGGTITAHPGPGGRVTITLPI
ncbi:MAG: sensor histidine kinase [Acidimicrobiales bacterium]